ncbi:MAG: hypothetical protein QW255_01665 [Candidatus Bilamarchaeaceae archaeon]
MPCMATTIPGVCEGEPDPNHPEWGPVAWGSVSDGTEKCNCPYTLANKCYGKYDDPNFCPKVVCSGTTIKKNGRCDSVTGNCVYDEGYCEFGCNADGTDCVLEKPVKPKQTYQKGDGICSITLGERCDNSPQDCICIGGKSCQPNASDADDAGCARDVKSKCGGRVPLL